MLFLHRVIFLLFSHKIIFFLNTQRKVEHEILNLKPLLTVSELKLKRFKRKSFFYTHSKICLASSQAINSLIAGIATEKNFQCGIFSEGRELEGNSCMNFPWIGMLWVFQWISFTVHGMSYGSNNFQDFFSYQLKAHFHCDEKFSFVGRKLNFQQKFWRILFLFSHKTFASKQKSHVSHLQLIFLFMSFLLDYLW